LNHPVQFNKMANLVNLGTVWPPAGKVAASRRISKTLARGTERPANAKRLGVLQSSGALAA